MNENIKKEISEMEKSKDIKTIDENYENLKAVITALTQDYEKFKSKKVKAAGQRVRNGLLNTKKLCDQLRKQVKEEINSIPVKHRKSSSSESEDSEEQKIGETIIINDGEYETHLTLTGIKEVKEEVKNNFVENFNEIVMKPLSEREVMEELGEIPKVITKPKRKRKVNKK